MPTLSHDIDLATVINGTGRQTPRTYHETFSLSSIILVPEENYRWQSEAAMAADLGCKTIGEDGTETTTYEVLKASIASCGVKEPVGLVSRQDGYHIIYGFTRVAAARDCGLLSVPAFVYHESVTDSEIRFLQIHENSASLKRAVNWISEVEAFEALVEQAAAAYEHTPAANRPRDENGDVIPAMRACRLLIAKSIGKSAGTMANRASLLGRLHPEIREAARAHHWSWTVCVEFVSGDARNPYRGDFVKAVVADLKRSDPDLKRITPDAVRGAKRRILADKGEAKVYTTGEAPVTAESRFDDDRRMTGGSARDCAADMLAGLLTLRKIGPTDPRLNKVPDTKVWQQVIGIGLATGDVRPPSCAVGRLLAHDADTKKASMSSEADAAMLDKQHEITGNRYATTALIYALLRNTIGEKVGDINVWSVAMTIVDGQKVIHRTAFHAAIRDAITWAETERVMPAITDIYARALSNLRDRLPVSAFQPKAKAKGGAK